MKTKLTELLIFFRVLQTILATMATVITITIALILITTYAQFLVTFLKLLLLTAPLIGIPAALWWWIYFSLKETDR